MNSYYDTILDRVENEMKRGCFEEAMKLLEEELSMAYHRKVQPLPLSAASTGKSALQHSGRYWGFAEGFHR